MLSRNKDLIKITYWPRMRRYTWKIFTRNYVVHATRGYTRKSSALRAARNKAARWEIPIKREISVTYNSRH